MRDLNTLLGSGGSGWNLTSCAGINDSGQIAGVGVYNGVRHSFLLTPDAPVVPLPSSVWSGLALLGGLVVVSRLRKRRQTTVV